MACMTSDQYTEFVAFLEQKFEEQHLRMVKQFDLAREERRVFARNLHARFDRVDTRLDRIDARLERMGRCRDGLRALE